MDPLTLGETGKAWTAKEIDLAIEAYLGMLDMEQRDERYIKVTVVRELRSILTTRSHSSVERKFQNISAILEEEGWPRIGGYVPLSGYQRDLRGAVVARLADERLLGEALTEYGVSLPIARGHQDLATSDVLVPPPGAATKGARRSSVDLVAGPMLANRAAQAKQLGDAGEAWVVDLERVELTRRGRGDLADQVIWAARDTGDGLGYDVKSFHPDGREHLIEVKTTSFGAGTPFFITRWEVDFSARRADAYSLYRVHGFRRDARIYVLDGSVAERADLKPIVFTGTPI